MTEYKSLSFNANAKKRERERARVSERGEGGNREKTRPSHAWIAMQSNKPPHGEGKNAALGEGADYYVKTELESPFPANVEKGERALYSH